MPPWAVEIRRTFTSSAASVFLLHGMRDVYRFGDRYLTLARYLHHVFCGDKVTAFYDIAQGIWFPSPDDEKAFDSFLEVLRLRWKNVPRPAEAVRPEIALPILEEFVFTRHGAAVVIDHVEAMCPREETRFMSFEERRNVTAIRRWASDPRLTRRNNFVFLLAETLSEVNEELYARGGGGHVINLPMAQYEERLDYINYLLQHPDLLHREGEQAPAATLLDMPPELFAEQTNGLTCLQTGNMLRTGIHHRETISVDTVSQWKRRALETEIGDLVEFVRPRLGLDAVAGVDLQKDILLNTARALHEGQNAVVPKGILLLGPPGCGKTFVMECFAHDCGIPFLQLKNIFSKYVGATEANLEKLFRYLDALAPVFVFIDEFDQSYGRRVTSDSDSGVSRRVFAMFNSYLSDESRQGKVLFGAATNRPDLIDPSTMRAGRFDLKLPFLLPEAKAREAILEVTFRTLKVTVDGVDHGALAELTEGYSGADLKELVRVAQRHAVFSGNERVSQADLEFAVDDYIPPHLSRGDDIRLMELLAVLGCTSRSLLPSQYLARIDDGSLQDELELIQTRVR